MALGASSIIASNFSIFISRIPGNSENNKSETMYMSSSRFFVWLIISYGLHIASESLLTNAIDKVAFREENEGGRIGSKIWSHFTDLLLLLNIWFFLLS